MKIVHILTRLLKAGSEENTLATCKAQIASGHEVYLVHGKEFEQSYYKTPIPGLHLVGVPELVHPLSPADDLKAYRALIQLLKSVKPHVVHTHQSKAGIVGRFAAQAARVPLVIHGVHIVPFASVGLIQRIVFTLAERLAAGMTHAFINVSKGTQALYLQAGIGRPDEHHVVHSGFDLSRFRTSALPDDWQRLLKMKPGAERPPVVLMLAALEQRKRHCEFLEAFSDLAARMPDVQLLLAGEGPHRPTVETTLARLGLQGNVSLLGYRTDPEKLIALADVCVLTSSREGLPRVFMQYVAGGKPCVTTHLPGVEEVVLDGVNGLVLPPDDIATVVSSVGDLLNDRARLGALAEGARRTDLSSWEVTHMCRKIEDIYQSELKKISAHAI